MKTTLAITFAAVYGLSLRMMFGFLEDFMGIMTISFLIIAPMVIGFFTVYFLPGVKNGAAAFFLPWATSGVILVITIILNIEGTICWIMIFPAFAILAGVGGVIAFTIRKRNEDKNDPNNWRPPHSWSIPFLFVLPALGGLIEGDRSLNRKDITITETMEIAATPEEVWYELTHINDIPVSSNHASFANLMGFPKHLGTTLDTLAVGGKRKAVYENGLYFDETIAQYEHGKLLVLDIKTDPTKIPPTVMDEHILIGGKHVDILQDVYTLEKLENGNTRLTLTSHFWINTPFNWYSGIWSEWLMSDILSGELELIKSRSEEK